jgi:hypothetical protein
MSHSSRNAVEQRHEAEVHMELLRAKLSKDLLFFAHWLPHIAWMKQ